MSDLHNRDECARRTALRMKRERDRESHSSVVPDEERVVKECLEDTIHEAGLTHVHKATKSALRLRNSVRTPVTKDHIHLFRGQSNL